MTTEADPAKIFVKCCNHTLSAQAQDNNVVYVHRGSAAGRCGCGCDQQPLTVIPSWKPLRAATRTEAAVSPPHPNGATSPPAVPAPVHVPLPPEVAPAQVLLPTMNATTTSGTRVSNSEIQTWKRCRRRWYISYVLNMLPVSEPRHGPLALGTAVHAALADYVTHGRHPARMLELYYDEVFKSIDPLDEQQLKLVRGDRELGVIMLEGYVDWAEQEGVDAGLRLVQSEAEVEVDDFAGTSVKLMAKLDVEVEREIDGAHLFRDWKTCQDFNAAKLLVLDEQMLTYMLIRRLTAPEGTPVTSGLYTMLRKVKRTERAKPPFYMQVEAYHGEQELRNFYTQLTGSIRELLQARNRLADGLPHQWVAPPTVDRSCTWQCPWLMPCQMMNDGSDWESVLHVIAQPGDPYARYKRSTTEDA